MKKPNEWSNVMSVHPPNVSCLLEHLQEEPAVRHHQDPDGQRRSSSRPLPLLLLLLLHHPPLLPLLLLRLAPPPPPILAKRADQGKADGGGGVTAFLPSLVRGDWWRVLVVVARETGVDLGQGLWWKAKRCWRSMSRATRKNGWQQQAYGCVHSVWLTRSTKRRARRCRSLAVSYGGTTKASRGKPWLCMFVCMFVCAICRRESDPLPGRRPSESLHGSKTDRTCSLAACRVASLIVIPSRRPSRTPDLNAHVSVIV